MAKHSRWVITGYHGFLARVQSPTCTNQICNAKHMG